MLTIDNLSCAYDDVTVFRGLGLTVGEGCALTIRGKNGGGKTTLLKALAGLKRPTEGEVSWLGDDIYTQGDDYLKSSHYIGHNNGLVESFTVQQQLEWWCTLYGQRELLKATIKYFKLKKLLYQPIHTLSRGWQRRVALSSLMLANHKVWLLDEPLSNLDKKARNLVESLIATKCDNGGIVILSSHRKLKIGEQITIDEYRK